jgi:hypothetical protein
VIENAFPLFGLIMQEALGSIQSVATQTTEDESSSHLDFEGSCALLVRNELQVKACGHLLVQALLYLESVLVKASGLAVGDPQPKAFASRDLTYFGDTRHGLTGGQATVGKATGEHDLV